MMHVKICGIRSVDEARKAILLGADFIGVLVDIPEKNLSQEKKQPIIIIQEV